MDEKEMDEKTMKCLFLMKDTFRKLWKDKNGVVGSGMILAFEDSTSFKMKFVESELKLREISNQWFSDNEALETFIADRNKFALLGLGIIVFSFRDGTPENRKLHSIGIKM